MHEAKPQSVLHCPNCQYDVSQSLRDQIYRCPECGDGLNPARCIRVYPSDPIVVTLIWRITLLFSMCVIVVVTLFIFTGRETTGLLLAVVPLSLPIIPSRLRVRRPPEALFPRTPLEYYLCDAGVLLFIAIFISVLLLGFNSFTTRP